MIHSTEIVRMKRASDANILSDTDWGVAAHGTCSFKSRAHFPHDEETGATGGSADATGCRGELQRTLELAARWLWRDGRPRAAVGHDLSILWSNLAARRLLVEPSPRVIRNDRLCPAKSVETAGVETFLAGLDSATARLYVMDAESDRGIVLTAWADTVEGHQIGFIEFALRELPFDAHQSGMARAFGLTKADAGWSTHWR